MDSSNSVTGSPTSLHWSISGGLPDASGGSGPKADQTDTPGQADAPVLMNKLFNQKSRRRWLEKEITDLAKEITCPVGKFGCEAGLKFLVENMELLERQRLERQRLESRHKDKALKLKATDSGAAKSVLSLPSHDFSVDCIEKATTKSHQKAFIALNPKFSKVSGIPEYFEIGIKHGHVEGDSDIRNLVVDGVVSAGALTVAGALTGGVAPTVASGVHYGGKFADHALPAVEAFLERNPLDNVTEDALRCMGDGDCHPHYLGLAVKEGLEVVQGASRAVDGVLDAATQPVKEMLDNLGVTDESVGQGVRKITVGPIHYAANIADQALPAVDAFLERNPLDNVTEDALHCMGDGECHPYYLGLAVKTALKGVQKTARAVDSTLEAVTQPVKKLFDHVGGE